MWLEMMREHHEGAVEMARAEQDDGRFPDAVEAGRLDHHGAGAEIETIDGLLS